MNQGDNLFYQVCSFQTLKEAWQKVKDNDGCAGGDDVTVNSYQRAVDGKLKKLSIQIKDGSYTPGPLRQLSIPKKDGGFRCLLIPSVADRIAQTAVAKILMPIFENIFSTSSFGYRPGRSVQMAVRQVSVYQRRGFTHVVEADIRRCFDRIPHDPMLILLEKRSYLIQVG